MNSYIYCLEMFIACLIPVLTVIILIKLKTKMSGEPFRKLLHTIAYLCPVCIMHFSDTWLTASGTLAIIGIIVYPLLVLVEKHPYYAKFFYQRHDGEVKLSMLQLFLGSAFIVAVCWGLFNMKYIAGCAILMWGPGDAAAALLGKRFGRHKINLPLRFMYHFPWPFRPHRRALCFSGFNCNPGKQSAETGKCISVGTNRRGKIFFKPEGSDEGYIH